MKYIVRIIIIVLVFTGCKREDPSYLGPAFISAPEGFSVAVFTASPDNIDFTKDKVLLNAKFSSNVSWKLTLKGQESGAIKELSGISDGFKDLVWTGVHDGLFFFRKGEKVSATLSFFGTDYTSSSTINILVPRDYTTYGQFPQYGDFEDPKAIIPSNSWFPFTGTGATFGCDSMARDYQGNLVPSIEGRKYYFLKGLGLQANFVGGIQTAAIANSKVYSTLPATPNNIWVNMFIYGTGDPNLQIELEYQEADGRNPGYNGANNDAFVAKITADHKGWKLFSFRYSDLVPSSNLSFGGSGNKIHEPETLASFDLILVKKSNKDSPVEVYFDFPIITVGGPFDPSK